VSCARRLVAGSDQSILALNGRVRAFHQRRSRGLSAIYVSHDFSSVAKNFEFVDAVKSLASSVFRPAVNRIM